MELENLVLPTLVGGLPALENAGAEQFQGFELEVDGANARMTCAAGRG